MNVDRECRQNNKFDYWDYILTDDQIASLCEYRKDFKYDNYKLSDYQLMLLCKCRNDFNYLNYIPQLLKHHLLILNRHRPDFKYWKFKEFCSDELMSILTLYPKDKIDINELTDEELALVMKVSLIH